jgi:hypothetical protein
VSKLFRYVQLMDGDWFYPTMHGHYDQCCDCGLVHEIKFKVEDGVVKFQVWRRPKLTAAARRTREVKQRLAELGGRTRRLDGRRPK